MSKKGLPYWLERLVLLTQRNWIVLYNEGASQVVLGVKNPSTNTGGIREVVQSLVQENPLEESIETHSSILAWAMVHRVAKSWT